jgi:hypothetical protein
VPDCSPVEAKRTDAAQVGLTTRKQSVSSGAKLAATAAAPTNPIDRSGPATVNGTGTAQMGANPGDRSGFIGALGTGTARVGAGPGKNSGGEVAGAEQKPVRSAPTPDRHTKIRGNPQRTGGPNGDAHAAASLKAAEELAKNPKVKTVHLNQSMRTATGDKTASLERLDANGVEETGPDGLKAVHMVEVQSPRQDRRALRKQMKSMENDLPPGYKPGSKKVITYEKVLTPTPDADPKIDPLFEPEVDPLIDPLIEPLIIP